jgi:hypothetical protein
MMRLVKRGLGGFRAASHLDMGGVGWFAEHVKEARVELPGLGERLRAISPMGLYEGLDVLSRDVLFYFSQDMGLGLGTSVVVVSGLIKLLWGPAILITQANFYKLKRLEPEMAYYQDMIRRHQMTGNVRAMKEVNAEFLRIKEKRGIKNWPMVVNFLQVPVLITWFLSLRYVCSCPELFPEVALPYLYL